MTLSRSAASGRPTLDLPVALVAGDSWDRLVARCPARTVFHGSPWLGALAARHGLEILGFVAGEPDRPVAIWPWLRQRKGPLSVCGSPLPGWGTAYMGPLLGDQSEPTDGDLSHGAGLTAILARPELQAASHLEARVVVVDQDVDLEPLGFTADGPFATYLLDLGRDEGELWTGLSNRCRNTVRKGIKNGYDIRRETGDDWIPGFYAMAREVFANWGLAPPYDPPLLQQIHDHLGSAGQLWVYSAWRGGERDATAVFLHDERRIYYWGAASYRRARGFAPNNLLLWEVIRAARSAGFEQLDFISSSGSAGRFKKNFGPVERVVCQRYSRSRTALEGALKRGYEAYARWRRSC